jgi:hypothetical protein
MHLKIDSISPLPKYPSRLLNVAILAGLIHPKDRRETKIAIPIPYHYTSVLEIIVDGRLSVHKCLTYRKWASIINVHSIVYYLHIHENPIYSIYTQQNNKIIIMKNPMLS